MGTRVTFVYPNVGCQIGFNYGLAHISAVLKQAGHEVELINVCEKLDPAVEVDAVAGRILATQPGLVGFSAVTNQFAYTCDLARAVRARSGVPLICGGPHATMAPDETIATGCFDFVCVGEGEYATLELADAIARGADTTAIRNIWARVDGGVRRNPVRPFCDLTALPRKDYELFDFQGLIDAKQGWVGLMATRGCPFRCTYCFNHAMIDLYRRDAGCKASDYIRLHPVDEVIDEIADLLANYERITTFIFDDDIFTLDKAHLAEFCRRYAERFDVPFVCNAHVKFFDAERAGLLKHAGCWMVKFGLESGSERIREQVLRRRMTNDQVIAAFDAAHDAGLQTSAFVMLGIPNETTGDMLATVDLLAATRPSRFRWSVCFPMPGTRLHEICVEENLIDEAKMAEQTNFMDSTCLRFDDEHLALLERLRRFLPWFVNAGLRGPVGDRFRPLVDRIRTAPEAGLDALDAECSAARDALAAVGEPLYEVRYNRFMAVRTDAPGV